MKSVEAVEARGDPSLEVVSLVTTVKATVGQVLRFIEYHRALGVNRIFLYIDDGDELLSSAVRSRHGRGAVDVVECTDEYWHSSHGIDRPPLVETRQKLNAGHALEIAKGEGIGWMAHIDVDEFIFCNGGALNSVLAGIPASKNVVRMRVFESLRNSVDDDGGGARRFFRSLPLPVSLSDGAYPLFFRLRVSALRWSYRVLFFAAGRLLRVPGIPSSYFGYYNAHYIGKSVFRVSDEVVRMGLHSPGFVSPERAQVICPEDCVMLHFESLSFDEWVGKWKRRMTSAGAAGGLDPRQREIFDAFQVAVASEDNLRALYETLYVMPHFLRRSLQTFGLVRQIPVELP